MAAVWTAACAQGIWARQKVKAKPFFTRANLQMFKKLVDVTPWETALRNQAIEQSWQLIKDIFLKEQLLSIPIYKKSGKEGRR